MNTELLAVRTEFEKLNAENALHLESVKKLEHSVKEADRLLPEMDLDLKNEKAKNQDEEKNSNVN